MDAKSLRNPGRVQLHFLLGFRLFVWNLIVEPGRLYAVRLAGYKKMMAFCPELFRLVEAKSKDPRNLETGQCFVEAKMLFNADVGETVTQYLAFNKKLFKSWGSSGSVSYMTDLGNCGWILTVGRGRSS